MSVCVGVGGWRGRELKINPELVLIVSFIVVVLVKKFCNYFRCIRRLE